MIREDDTRPTLRLSIARAPSTFAMNRPLTISLFYRVLLRCFSVLALEPLHAPGRVNQLLLAREKWMAARANFHAYQFALVRRARLKRAPARAMYFHSVVFRMYSLFHAVSPVYPERFPRKAYPICPRSRFLALNAGPVGTGARARRGAQRTLPVARSADNLSSYANLSRLP